MNIITQQPAPDFGEPWDFDGENWITDSHNTKIINLDSMHSKNAKRLIACVNACAGMADPAAEIQAMREAIRAAYEVLDEADGSSYHIQGDACLTKSAKKKRDDALAKLRPFLQ